MDSNYKFDPYYLNISEKEIKLIQHEDQYIYNLKKKNKPSQARRKIYENVEYTDYENKGISDLKEAFEKNNQNPKKEPMVLPSNWRESDWLKMCYTARFDIKKCLEKMRSHLQWRNDQTNFEIDEDSKQLFEKGFFYQLGRDKGNRPVLYMDATKITLKDGKENIIKAISVYLNCVKKYMFHDYAIENWVVILDLHGMGLSSIPTKALGAIIGHMSTNFCATLERMYILNPSATINFLWGTVTAFLDDETTDKIRMLKKKELSQIQEQIPNLRYIQKQHGGEVPDIEKDYWPPINVYNIDKPQPVQDVKQEQVQYQDQKQFIQHEVQQFHKEEQQFQPQEYKSSYNNDQYTNKQQQYNMQQQEQIPVILNENQQSNQNYQNNQQEYKNIDNNDPTITVGKVEDKLIVNYSNDKAEQTSKKPSEKEEVTPLNVTQGESQSHQIIDKEIKDIERLQNENLKTMEFGKFYDEANAQNGNCKCGGYELEGNENQVQKLKKIVEDGNIPNMILVGPPGIGKTSSVLCIAKQLLQDKYKEAVLEKNASDDRGIDVVRQEIKEFSQKKVNLREGLHKIIILDEADSMTEGAQQALRMIISDNSETTRFVLSCNDSTKLIDAIQSRCAILRFTKLTEKEILKRIMKIIELENIPYDEDALSMLLFTTDGDMRQAINNLQATYMGFKKLTKENIQKVCDIPNLGDLEETIQYCIDGDFQSAQRKIYPLWQEGYTAFDLVQTLYKLIINRGDIDKKLEYIFLKELAYLKLKDLQQSGLFQEACDGYYFVSSVPQMIEPEPMNCILPPSKELGGLYLGGLDAASNKIRKAESWFYEKVNRI
ncbi:P-loop containing nucleoside triphosphate hydrolase [Pseudocohnilembus persalinus]|uniref:p-loop containing nucleoside triphosphate hydrolase n=1 Tax=Pseudocohnilembus persalinus TaxID=266149 RepID=A0A0V0Q831_PSEPJ|nr:P-loop containing nucleoside triphosphate hydrolase [Pseudocohnilembus persalinus]|eukprot:KRW98377.1 P-loop containing nucleoside triphosphate hydrolase [Pseudocohnilembus persalinus]